MDKFQSFNTESPLAQRRLMRSSKFFTYAGLFLCWWLPSTGQLRKYLSPISALIVSLCVLITICGILHYSEVALLKIRTPQRRWLFLVWALHSALILTLHPLTVARRKIGMGSDREDALRLGASSILHGHYPYSALTFLHNPLTPLPGAFILASPFYLAHAIEWQNLFWSGCFLIVCTRIFQRPITVILYYSIFLIASPAFLQDQAAGGDYVTTALYLTCAIFLLSCATKFAAASPLWLASILCGLTLSSRPVYAVALPVICALLLKATSGIRASIAMSIIVATAATCTLPFYLHDPRHFSPLSAGGMALAPFPPALHMGVSLPVVAMLVASMSFFVPLNTLRCLVFIGAACAVMVAPVFLYDQLFARPFFPLTNAVYLAPAALFIAAGLMARWESSTLSKSMQAGL